jgi:hypothetical protein
MWVPIHIAYSSGVNISGNKISKVIPFIPGGFPYSLSAGILCGPWYLTSQKYLSGAITGHLKISNNIINLEASSPATTVGQAIFVNFTTGINATISENVIENASRNSIEFLDNYRANGVGTIVVERNEVTTSEAGVPFPGPLTPNGIVFGWSQIADQDYNDIINCLYTVMHNTVRIKGTTSVGIMGLADGAGVINNHIASEGSAAQGLFITGDNGYIAHNKIEGRGLYAINVLPSPAKSFLDGSYNFFQGNNFNLFDATQHVLHFAKGADHNVFVGHSGSVWDEGDDNRITNFKLIGKTSELGPKSFYHLTGQGRR